MTNTSTVTPVSLANPGTRLSGLDALRGIAALLVMMFHYTTRYADKFGHTSPTAFSVPWGYLGVNLFFMISGFVIFMTLERTTRPADFLVSRFSRLFPAYWVAVIITFVVLATFAQLGKVVSVTQALENGLMFHGLFGVDHIDGVYWTLEIELLFYWAMFLLWLTGGFAVPGRWVTGWLLLCVVLGAAQHMGVAFPYVIAHVLILPYFAFFALGIVLYRYHKTGVFRYSNEGALVALALLAIGLIDTPLRVVWACGFIAVFVLFMSPFGAGRPIVALSKLGAISYPLYLLHENLGWTLIWHLEAAGMNPNVAIAITVVAALALATALHVLVEGPAMRAIRSWRRSSAGERAPEFTRTQRRRWIAGTLLVGAVVLVGNRWSQRPRQPAADRSSS